MNVMLSEPTRADGAAGSKEWPSRAALLSGVVLLFGGYGFHPDLPPGAAEAIAAVGGVRNQYLWSKLAVAAGGLVMTLMLFVILRRLITGRGRVLGTIGVVMAGLGLAFNSMSQAVHGYLLWWASAPGLDSSAAVDFVAAAENPDGLGSLPVSYFSVPLFGIGLLAFGIALWRAGTVPPWVAPTIIVVVLATSAFNIGLPMLVLGALAVVGFGAALASLPASADMPT